MLIWQLRKSLTRIVVVCQIIIKHSGGEKRTRNNIKEKKSLRNSEKRGSED